MAAAVTDAFKGDSHPLPLCVSTSVGKVPTSVPGPAPRSGHGRTTFENAVASNCTLVPSNRLVAGTLERRRNDAIQRLNESSSLISSVRQCAAPRSNKGSKYCVSVGTFLDKHLNHDILLEAYAPFVDQRYHGRRWPRAKAVAIAHSLPGWRDRNDQGISTPETRRRSSLSRRVCSQDSRPCGAVRQS